MSVLKERIKNREKMVGMYVHLSDISIARIAGLSGYDFIWVDTEHSYLSTETVMQHIYAIKSTGTPVIVRVPQDDLTATKHILEIGVDGILFPMIQSAEDANRVISNTLYPPYGKRGCGPMGATNYGMNDFLDYLHNDHKDLCRFVQLEHKNAIEDLDEIMKNEYIDGYVFGPADLAGSYNMPGMVFSEEIKNVMTDAIKKLRDNGKYVAIASGGYADEIVKYWASFNPDMISAGADFEFIRDGAVNNRINLEKLLKNK